MTDSQAAEFRTKALTAKEDVIRDLDDNFFKFNAGQKGFYRTNYPLERLAKLGRSKDKLDVEDRIGLVGDSAALAIAGNTTTASLLTFLENFHDEPNYA
jgi:aminopeptidase N